MKKVISINAYEKKGKKIVVLQLDNGDVLFVNYGLVKYALDNIKKGRQE